MHDCSVVRRTMARVADTVATVAVAIDVVAVAVAAAAAAALVRHQRIHRPRNHPNHRRICSCTRWSSGCNARDDCASDATVRAMPTIGGEERQLQRSESMDGKISPSRNCCAQRDWRASDCTESTWRERERVDCCLTRLGTSGIVLWSRCDRSTRIESAQERQRTTRWNQTPGWLAAARGDSASPRLGVTFRASSSTTIQLKHYLPVLFLLFSTPTQGSLTHKLNSPLRNATLLRSKRESSLSQSLLLIAKALASSRRAHSATQIERHSNEKR